MALSTVEQLTLETRVRHLHLTIVLGLVALPTSHAQAPTPATGRYAAIERLEFNRRAVEWAEPLFWTSDAKDDDASKVERVPSPFDLENAVTLRLAIDRALAQLPMEYRSAVVLRDIQGLDYKEIAETLGVPIGTVESRIFRGRRRLRMLLDPLRGRPDSVDQPPRGALSWAKDD